MSNHHASSVAIWPILTPPPKKKLSSILCSGLYIFVFCHFLLCHLFCAFWNSFHGFFWHLFRVLTFTFKAWKLHPTINFKATKCGKHFADKRHVHASWQRCPLVEVTTRSLPPRSPYSHWICFIVGVGWPCHHQPSWERGPRVNKETRTEVQTCAPCSSRRFCSIFFLGQQFFKTM